MKISVVVPAYNEEKLLGDTLRHIRCALRSFQKISWETELIVCDNNSTDQTARIAAAENARVVFEPINQISRARNAGAAAATGEWLVFVDADSRPSPELFAAVAEQIRSETCLGGGAVVSMPSVRFWLRTFIWLWNSLSISARWMAGSFIFCRRDAFREVDGFSKELYVSEELDFSQKLKRLARQKGMRIVILKNTPLETSDRKLHLYGPRDYLKMLWQTIIQRGRNFRTRSGCPVWYDGRR